MANVLYRIYQHSFVEKPRESEVYSHLTQQTEPEKVCEELFAAWNNGSGQECWAFKKENQSHNIHSLSVDDIIALWWGDGSGTQWWKCDAMGWTQLNHHEFLKERLRCLKDGTRYAQVAAQLHLSRQAPSLPEGWNSLRL